MSTRKKTRGSGQLGEKSPIQTSMKADRPLYPGELNIDQWEQSHHGDLIQVYKAYFEKNEKFECTYTDFVIYCYNHSSKHKSPSGCE